MSGDNNIFPLLNRHAPILERVRGEQSTEELTEPLSQLIADSVQSDNKELKDETHKQLVESITSKLASELGVSDDNIDNGYTEQVADLLISSDETDVLTLEAQEKLGIKLPDDNDVEDDEDNMFD